MHRPMSRLLDYIEAQFGVRRTDMLVQTVAMFAAIIIIMVLINWWQV